MPLHDAILALSPNHYWQMNGAAGDLTLHDEVGARDFTATFNDGGGVLGPEVGTTAQRIYSDQSWQTTGFGASAFGNQTWLMLFSVPANGAPAAYTDVLGWSDPSNHVTRGWRIQQQSTSNNSESLRLAGSSGQFGGGGIAQPIQTWHLLAWYIQASPAQTAISLDGLAWTPTSSLPGLSYQTTDPIWIQSPYPIVIAHLASFTTVLTPAQIQTVSSQILAWPYQQPINLPFQGTTTVDLTPVTDDTATILANQTTFMPQIANTQTIVGQTHTQTTTIQTDVQNIINSLFPQLGDDLSTILGAVTSTITGIGGAVSSTLGDLFSHKTIDNLTQLATWDACAPSVIHAELGGGTIFGIEMECTSYPDYTTFTGWGEDYTEKSLGTLVISRGDNTIYRTGLHNLSKMVYPLPAVPSNVFEQLLPVVPGSYTVILTPAPDTCWHLIALGFP
jgi:hypothetical protein